MKIKTYLSVVTIAVLCCTLSNCAQSSNNESDSTPADSIAEVDNTTTQLDLEQLETINEFYLNKFYQKEDRVLEYCTDKLIKQLKKDYQDEYFDEGDGIAIWEFSTISTDPGPLSYEGAKKTGENTYIVRLKDTLYNNVNIITLTLVNEDGKWKFDSCKISNEESNEKVDIEEQLKDYEEVTESVLKLEKEGMGASNTFYRLVQNLEEREVVLENLKSQMSKEQLNRYKKAKEKTSGPF